MRVPIIFVAMVVAAIVGGNAIIGEKSVQAAAVDGAKVSYAKDVKPILADRCFGCHNPGKKKAGIDLQSSYVSMMRTVKEGKPDDSKLYKSLVGKGAKQMPPKKRISDEEIDTIKAWIAAGAKNN